MGYLFLALDAVQVERLASHDDLEEMHVEYLSTDELACALHSGLSHLLRFCVLP